MKSDTLIEITETRLLAVEGKDECLFFQALLKKLELSNIQTICYGGKTRLRDYMGALIVTPGWANVTMLGIARDADRNPEAAFQSVVDTLRAYNLSPPKRPLMVTRNKPRVIVMILPDENTPGMLEDLCLRTVMHDSSIKCVEEFFICLKRKRISPPNNMAKAKVHAFLASRIKADKRLGEAAQAGYWHFNSRSLTQVKKFLCSISRG